MAISEAILQIVNKHAGSQLTVVYRDDKTVKLYTGILKGSTSENILLNESAQSSGTGKLMVNYEEKGAKKILAIYNANFVNLTAPHKNENMAVKIKNREKSTKIIAYMRPYLKKIVTVIYKKGSSMLLLNGEFSNMGMQELTIKPAPFFNNEDVMMYSNIMHVFDENGLDLIDV